MTDFGLNKKKRTGFKHRRVGLTLGDGYLSYGHGFGWFIWAPMWFKHAVAQVWNSIQCMRRGHDDMLVDLYRVLAAEDPTEEPPRCCYCLTELRVDGKYVTPVLEPWWKKSPTKEEIAAWRELAEQLDPPEDFPDPS